MRSVTQQALLVVALVLLVGCASLAPLEESMIFFPTRYPQGDWNPHVPAIEDACFEAPDGVRLHGWYGEAEQPRAVVLYMHGNAGDITSRQDVLRFYRERLHASILVFDYRGYGKSEGQPTEAGVLADARAARRWLAGRTGVAEIDIVLVGNSLGGGVAVDLAARDGTRGLVLENTFTSLPDVAAHHFTFLPVRWLMSMHLDSLAKIRDYHGPLLQTHGDADRIIPFDLGQQLFAAANEPKQFICAVRGDHNDPPPHEYLIALDRFLDALPAHGQAASIPSR